MMCSRQVNEVAVSATPNSATVEPSTIVGRRRRTRSGNGEAGLTAADGPLRWRNGSST